MNTSGLKVVQINLHYCDSWRKKLLTLIHEPWFVLNKVSGIRSVIICFFLQKQIIRKDIKLLLISNYSSGNQTGFAFKRNGLPTLILTSGYLPYDGSDQSSNVVRELIK